MRHPSKPRVKQGGGPLNPPTRSQRKGTPEEEAHASADLKQLAFDLFSQCDAALSAGIPLVDASSDLGRDDVLAEPFRVSGRTIYAAIVAWETTRTWAYKFRDHGLGVHVDYVLFRPIIENLLTVVWILGPADPAVRVERALRAWEAEISDSARFSEKVKQLSGEDNYPGLVKHVTAIEQLEEQFAQVAGRAGIALNKKGRGRGLSYTTVATEAGELIPQLGRLTTYWVWSVSSGMTHGQPLVGTNMSNYDATDRGTGDLDALVEASPRVVLYYVQAIQVMLNAVADLFHERLAVRA